LIASSLDFLAIRRPPTMADEPSVYAPSSVSGSVKSRLGDAALLTYDELDEKAAIRYVADDGAGATVLFSGTTRGSFKGQSRSLPHPSHSQCTDIALFP